MIYEKVNTYLGGITDIRMSSRHHFFVTKTVYLAGRDNGKNSDINKVSRIL